MKSTSTYIYIAAPYTQNDTVQNVRCAIDIAHEILEKCENVAVFLPHLYHFWNLMTSCPRSTWTALCLDWLEKCDIVLRLPGESKGADLEVRHAFMLKIPVVYSLENLLAYIKE